jgi:ketosteroid isomerase-like protein
MKSALLTLACGVLALSACSHATIANTPIEDTKENRDVLQVLANYKLAVEAKDIDGLMSLISPTYMDVTIPGRAKETKDYEQLKTALKDQFARTKSIRLEVHPRDVKVEGNFAFVDYFYVVRYDPILPSGTTWRSETDDARLKLERQQGKWKIISGL